MNEILDKMKEDMDGYVESFFEDSLDNIIKVSM